MLPAAVLCCAAAGAYEGSAFRDVREAVFRDPYAELPVYPVERDLLGPGGDREANRLRRAARRTLTLHDDLFDFPLGRKLLQANGICFAGRWRVDRPSPYSGLFARDAEALAIARASVALGEPRRGARRSFSLAVKLFPTRDPADVVPTANLLLTDSIAGTLHPHFLDAVLDNEPDLGGLPSLGQLPLALRIRADLAAADGALSPGGGDPFYRPVDAPAAAGIGENDIARAPHWVRMRVAKGTPRVDAADFREELAVARYSGAVLTWVVEAAAEHPRGKAHAQWQRLGTLALTESVVSHGCDARLHFAHPRLQP